MKLNKSLSVLMVSCSSCSSVLRLVMTMGVDDQLSLGAPVLTEIAAPTAIATSDVMVSQKDFDEGAQVMAYGFCYHT